MQNECKTVHLWYPISAEHLLIDLKLSYEKWQGVPYSLPVRIILFDILNIYISVVIFSFKILQIKSQ